MTQQKKWYQQNGADYDVVLSTRVRLARNLRGFPFPAAMTEAQRREVGKLVRDAIENGGSSLRGRFYYIELESLKQYELVSLVERHLVSPDFVRQPKGRALLLLDDESVSIMICEEDHLRIQAMSQGLELEKTYELADRLDTLLSERLDFAADRKLGYLTACPTNLGTAMRASVMLHLLGLESSGALLSVSKSAASLGLTLRGLYGEGTQGSGSIFQLSNQETLGVTEKQSLSKLSDVTGELLKAERNARTRLAATPEVQDKVWRSLGVLRSARMLSGSEFMNLFSVVRMGATAGILQGISPEGLTSLFIDAQPATLMQSCGEELAPAQRDIKRAELVRQFVGN